MLVADETSERRRSQVLHRPGAMIEHVPVADATGERCVHYDCLLTLPCACSAAAAAQACKFDRGCGRLEINFVDLTGDGTPGIYLSFS